MGPLSSDPLDILVRSDAWGTRRVIELCGRLKPEQMHTPFPIGPGSLHETLVHTIGAMQRWADRIAQRTPRPWMHTSRSGAEHGTPGRDYTLDELAALLDDAERELLAVAADVRRSPDATFTLDWPGKDGSTLRYTFSRSAALVHVCTHGHYHRAQCMNMLRHLDVPGVSDALPELGAVDWQEQVERPPEIIPARASVFGVNP